jgi:hypothetical protein
MGDKRMREEYKNCIADLTKQKSVPQHGKEYFTVATRHNLFMKYFSNYASINTDIIPELCNDNRVAVKCTIYINSQTYTGMALEEFGSSFINKTSALENAETSALGRALAAFGLHGTEFASADELINAKMNQNKINTNLSFTENSKQEFVKKFMKKNGQPVSVNANKIPKSNGKKNIKLDMELDMGRIKSDIQKIKDIYALRKWKAEHSELFDSNNKSLREYRQIDDFYTTHETKLNQGVITNG